MSKPLDPMTKLARENERLRIDNSNVRSLNKKLLRRGGGYDGFIEELKEVLVGDVGFKYKAAPVQAPKEVVDKAHEEIACVAVSDLHLSEVVSLEDSNGINIYNSVIAANRLWEHCQKVKSILRRHMAVYTLKKIWSPLLGDIINGTIHAEMLITNDLTNEGAVVLGCRLLHMFYEELKSLGLPIEIDAIIGNHPRTTIKMPTKRAATTNYDWVTYESLGDKFAKDDQVGMTIHTSQIGMKKIYGFNFLFEHGIGVQSGKEEDFEDRIRALFDDPTYRAATGYTGAAFDQLIIGNMHKSKFLERTIVNGAYTGQNELGQSWRLKPIKAIQQMWGVSKKHARTWQYSVDLTGVRSQNADNPMSSYAKWFLKRYSS